MAKLCSYYPLHFMRAVIIVNPRGLLYHVRGSREENGVGWCMANWKCHSYLFISTTRPLYTRAHTHTHTLYTHGHAHVPTNIHALRPYHQQYTYIHTHSRTHPLTFINSHFQKHTSKNVWVLQILHLKLLP